MQKLPFEEVKRLMRRDHGSEGEDEGLRPVSPPLKIPRLRSSTKGKKAAAGTPDTVKGGSSISSISVGDSVEQGLPGNLDLKEAKRRFLEAHEALKRAQEKEIDAGEEPGSEVVETADVPNFVFYHDPIPPPPLIVGNTVDEWLQLRAYEERSKAQGKPVVRRAFLSEGAFAVHLLRVESSWRAGVELPSGMTADPEGCLRGPVEDFYRFIRVLHGAGSVARVASPTQLVVMSFGSYD